MIDLLTDWLHRKLATLQGRSSHWPAVRDHFLQEHPTCAACGTDKDLDVHHLKPFHTHPELELDEANLLTLCRLHHLDLGHCGDWKLINVNCVAACQNHLTNWLLARAAAGR